ncbi:acireductone synthase [Planctomycetota bacterium]|nr:acireductone synthase [Planctomycetota bacterium]
MTRAILVDIEGTTSSIAFVKDVLFPYAREHMSAFIATRGDDEAVRAQLDAVRAETDQPDLSDAEVANVLCAWIDTDKKATPLKALQGLIWERGYREGDYRAHMYPDATDHLRAWHAEGIPLYVYSSGSVKAQHLFFEFSQAGNLRDLFQGHFDTTTGPKKEAPSYAAIAKAIDVSANEVLFLSDVAAELDAAREVGMKTCWLVRDGELPKDTPHPVARDFTQVPLAR